MTFNRQFAPKAWRPGLIARAGIVIVLFAIVAKGRITSQQLPIPTYKSSSTLVNVPTTVSSQSGEAVKGLTSRQFRLTDNGVEQSLLVEEAKNVPLSLIVIMQVGGSAPASFRDYAALDVMLQTTFGNSIHQIALVMFDSHPEQIWNFPLKTDFLYFGLTHPDPGDHGAAILDALDCGVDLFRQTPPSFRPVIVLLSQGEDQGSHANLQKVLKRTIDSGVVVFSLTFPEKRMRAKGSSEEHENAAEAVAKMSGGDNFSFTDSSDLAKAISAAKTDAENFYLLSFQPTSQEPGFHSIAARVVNQRESLRILSRKGYWRP